MLIEKGDNITPESDFKQTINQRSLLKYIKCLKGEGIQFTFAEGLGGGSGFYEMVSFRAPSQAFNLRNDSGKRLWPTGFERKSLDPYYQIAEEKLNVHQIEKDCIPKNGIVFCKLMRNLGYSVDIVSFFCLKIAAAPVFVLLDANLGLNKTLSQLILEQPNNLV